MDNLKIQKYEQDSIMNLHAYLSPVPANINSLVYPDPSPLLDTSPHPILCIILRPIQNHFTSIISFSKYFNTSKKKFLMSVFKYGQNGNITFKS